MEKGEAEEEEEDGPEGREEPEVERLFCRERWRRLAFAPDPRRGRVRKEEGGVGREEFDRPTAKRREGLPGLGSRLRCVMFSISIRRLITPTNTPAGGGEGGGRVCAQPGFEKRQGGKTRAMPEERYVKRTSPNCIDLSKINKCTSPRGGGTLPN